MATSGSINFSATRDSIITEALEQLNVLAEGQSPSSDQLTSCSRTLNMIVKSWQANGLNLFALQRLYVFLETDKVEYSLSSSGDNFTTSYVTTTTSSASVETDTTIEVASITGISASDNIGVELSDGSMQWTTVDGAPSGTTVTLSDALTDDVNTSARVYVYTTTADRPMRIYNAVRRTSSNIDTPLKIINRSEYVMLSNKQSEGSVLSIYYDPQVGTGKLFVYPEPTNTTDILVLWVQRTLEDFDAASDDVDFPQEWYLPLALGLAAALLPKYNVPNSVASRVMGLFSYYKAMADGFDSEQYVKIEPEYM